MKTDNPNKQLFLDNYKDCHFNITATCEKIGIGRTTYHDWYNSDPEFKKLMDDYRECIVDLAEDVLIKTMKGKNKSLAMDAAKHVSKHLGKKRGYGEKVDITTNGESINTVNIKIIKSDGDKPQGD